MPQVIEYSDQAEWLELRQEDVTSTEVAALFGQSPYLTAYELWHRKRGFQAPDFEPSARMKWGNRLEPAIAAGVAEDQGWVIAPFKKYLRHSDEKGMGSSFDFEVLGVARCSRCRQAIMARPIVRNSSGTCACGGLIEMNPGLLEIKNVDVLAYRSSWVPGDGDGDLEAPAHIEIQVQHQLEVADREWAAIVALVGGNDPKVVIRQRDRAIGLILREKIRAFWSSVLLGQEPAPDYGQDAKFIGRLRGFAEPGKVLQPDDGPARDHLVGLFDHYSKVGAEIKALEEDRDATKAQVLTLVGDAERVLVPGFSVSLGVVAETEMHYVRRAYRGFRVTAKKTTQPTKEA